MVTTVVTPQLQWALLHYKTSPIFDACWRILGWWFPSHDGKRWCNLESWQQNDSEAAVTADRYRKGPISSAYAMQQEMASVKAQKRWIKNKVSDLKAENKQMKAQIAAMMAKMVCNHL